MVTMKEIERQLKENGATFTFISKPEIRELQHILMPYEQIKFCISGRYAGGFAIICATDLRLLLVDKKFMYLTIEDVRYDMVVEVDYGYRMIDATMSVVTPSKTLHFVSTKKLPLRQATNFIQQRVMEVRQQQGMQYPQSTEQIMAANLQPQTVAARATFPTQDSGPLVSVQNIDKEPTKQFVPKLPLKSMGAAGTGAVRRIVNPYTQTPLSTRRRVSRFYPS